MDNKWRQKKLKQGGAGAGLVGGKGEGGMAAGRCAKEFIRKDNSKHII